MLFKKNKFFVALACFAMSLVACGGGGNNPKPKDPTVDSIAVKANSVPTEFTVGDQFSITGGKLIVGYSDNSTEEVDMTMDMIKNPPAMTEAVESYTVNVEYLEKQTSYNITINAPVVTVTEIRIKNPEVLKTSYYTGEEFTVEGGILTVIKSDSTREEVNMTLQMIKNAPDMSEVHENYVVQVEYEGCQTTYTINVLQADTRAEVSIGISYAYNKGDYIEIEDFTKELVFTQGKQYEFTYGCRPSEAKESLGYQYWTRGEEPARLDEKPTAIGEYTYKVILPEGDEAYKPGEQSVNYKIIEPVIKEFVLDKDNVSLDNDTQEIEGITINYKGAEAAEDAVAKLTRVAASKPAADDNYIEIATAVSITEGITVEFKGINRYVYIYGSFDGENFTLLDTLTRAKQTSYRVSRHFYFRLVCASAGEESIVIVEKVSFKYEVGDVPEELVKRAERSDLINDMTPNEDGAFYSDKENLFDSNLSTNAIKINNIQISSRIHLGFEVTHFHTRYVLFSFKFKLDSGVTFEGYNDEETQLEPKTDMSFYAGLPRRDGKRVGVNYKINKFSVQEDWATAEFYLGDLLGDDIVDVTEINFWINRKLTGGFVHVDDFRVEQVNRFPIENTIDRLELVEGSVTKTEFQAGEEFVFGGQVKAMFTDYTIETIDESDERLSVKAPDMTTNGTKDVTVTFTYYGIAKSVTYKITITGGVNPKDEETLPIVAEENDLAKVSCRQRNQSSMDSAVVKNETEMTYGNSTNSLKVSNLKAADASFFLKLPTPLAENVAKTKVKFFAKNLPAGEKDNGIYIQLLKQLEENAEGKGAKPSSTTEKSAKAYASTTKTPAFTATDAGNGWTLFEYEFDTSMITSGVGTIWFAIPSGCVQSDNSVYYLVDGLEITSVVA